VATLVIGAVALVTSSSASTISTTLNLTPTDDTYISQAAKTTNYGTATTMATNGAKNKVKRVYFRFSVNGLPANATVTGARIVLTALNSSGIVPTLKKQTTGSWTETTLTYANAPTLGSNITSPPAIKAGPVTFQVQNIVKGNGSFSFGLIQGSSKETTWATKESATPPQLILTYSQPSPSPSPSASPSASPTPIPDAGQPCGTADAPPVTYDHVIWIMMENKYYTDVIGNTNNAPYINALVNACATVQGQQDASGGVDIDSLPEYIAYTSGGTQGLTANVYPADAPLSVDNLFRQTLNAGLSAKSYSENMPGNCVTTDNGTTSGYRVKHNPWPYYVDDAAACQQFDVPMGTTTSGAFLDDLTNGTLPNFALIQPNMVDDMHNGSSTPAKVRNGDGWLQQWMPMILGSDTYKAGSTAVFVLWDEYTPVPNLFIAPSVHPGTVLPVPADPDPAYSHYSVLRTTEEMLNITDYLGNAATAPSLRTPLNF
jgi:hypothetical protein